MLYSTVLISVHPLNQPLINVQKCLLPLELPLHFHPITPFRLSQRARFELPAHSKFPLATYLTHGNVYFSMLLSPFVPLSFPALCHKNVLCLHLTATWRDSLCLSVGRLSSKDVSYSWIKYRFNAIPIKISATFLYRLK